MEMSERNIGVVKQIIRYIQQDSQLHKRAWPALLTKVSFHCNGMRNNSTRVSPHMLTYGREPPCPIDAWCKVLKGEEVNSHSEHLELLKRKQAEIETIARENADRNLQTARERYNKDRAESQVVAGDFIFLKRQARVDSLTPKFDGPYQILVRREANVKLRLPRRDKWVHLDNCKRYTGDLPQVILQQPRALTGGECEDIGESQPESDSIPPILNGEEVDTASEGEDAEERRYPKGEKRPPWYLADYTDWDRSPHNGAMNPTRTQPH